MRTYKSHDVNLSTLLTPDGVQPLESVCLKKDDVLSVPRYNGAGGSNVGR